jgi:hypothetical protein
MAMMPSGELSAPSTERNMTSSGEYGRTVAASIVGSKRFFGKIAYRQPRTVRGRSAHRRSALPMHKGCSWTAERLGRDRQRSEGSRKLCTGPPLLGAAETWPSVS